MKIDRWRALYAVLSLLLFLGGTSWLVAPLVNHDLARGPNLISEYESINMPHNLWFRAFDLLSLAAVVVAITLRRHHIVRHYGRRLTVAVFVLIGLGILDVVVPLHCRSQNLICSPTSDLTLWIHGIESYTGAGLTLAIAIYLARRHKKALWLPWVLAGYLLLGIALRNSAQGLLFGLQAGYSILHVYLLWYITLADTLRYPLEPSAKRIIRSGLALAISLNAILGILQAVLHLSVHSTMKGLLFTSHTAWLSQHTFLASLALLFLARAVRQGSINAWRTVCCITYFEVIKFASISPDIEPLLAYTLIFVSLLLSRGAFDKHHSVQRFVGRLKNASIAIALTALSVTLLSGLFRVLETKQWDQSAFTPSRILIRTLLIEVRSDPHDSLHLKMFGQILTATGVFVYGWLFFGLFLPSLLPNKEQSIESSEFSEALHRYGTQSEDAIKLWPPDKSYWKSNRSMYVAYKLSGAYAFALADPIGPARSIGHTIKNFNSFCRTHGLNACWLMITNKSVRHYKHAGLRTMPIGASAVVGIDAFRNKTIKTKWWRWIRNKSMKQGYSHHLLTPPHSQKIIRELKQLSDAWLTHNNHKERTFTLGYFDEAYLQSCVLHTLKNDQDDYIAFANQLPTYGSSVRTTIDLMRYLPELDGVMAFLLSEIILDAGRQGYAEFDLGFVPLTDTGKQHASKALIRLGKKVLRPVFSVQGLEQFKNKFEPEWEQNHIAWGGDLLDIPVITSSLQKALTYQPNKQPPKG